MLAAHGATKTIPIIFSTTLDPATLGLVRNHTRPGGNATGAYTVSSDLSANDNIKLTLENFHGSSEKLKGILNDLDQVGEDLKTSGGNIKELTQTVKSQPWRLIWPSTKKYPEDNQTSPPDTITVKKTAKTQRRPSPTPAPRTR